MSLLPEDRSPCCSLQEEGQGRGQGQADSSGSDGVIVHGLGTSTRHDSQFRGGLQPGRLCRGGRTPSPASLGPPTSSPAPDVQHQCRVVFSDEVGEALGVEFTVTNVTKVIISADAMVERGYVATLAGDGSYLEHPLRGRIPLHRFGRTSWMRLKRASTEAKVCVAAMVRTPPEPRRWNT